MATPRSANRVPQFDQYSGNYRQMLDQSIAASGESGEYFAQYKARWVSAVAGEEFAGTVLDFGCGVGLLSSQLRKHMTRATLDGFDPSEESIKAVTRDLASAGRFTSHEDQLRSQYDVIVVANVLHHVPPPERAATLRWLAQRLAVGGRLFVFEHNPANPLTRRAVDSCAFDADAVLLPPREFLGLANDAGLRVERLDYIVFFPRWLKWFRALESRLRWCGLGAQWAAVAGCPCQAPSSHNPPLTS